MITCSNLAQKCAVQVCHVAAIVIETAQIVTAVLVSGCIVRSAQSQLKLLGFFMFIHSMQTTPINSSKTSSVCNALETLNALMIL